MKEIKNTDTDKTSYSLPLPSN